MKLKDLPDWHDLVAANWRKTTGYVLAFGGPCLQVRDEELAAVKANRVLVGLSAAELAQWSPTGSWFLAVLLCKGDTVADFVRWVRHHKVDPERIHFYAHPDADPFAALAAWEEAALGPPAADEGIDSWKAFHRKFGKDLAVRILQDWG